MREKRNPLPLCRALLVGSPHRRFLTLMHAKELICRTFGSTLVRYLHAADGRGAPGLQLVPAASARHVVTPRAELDEACVQNLLARWLPLSASEVDALVQIHVQGDPRPRGFALGRSLRGGESTAALRLIGQTEHAVGGVRSIVTRLGSPGGLELEHKLSQREGDTAFASPQRLATQERRPSRWSCFPVSPSVASRRFITRTRRAGCSCTGFARLGARRVVTSAGHLKNCNWSVPGRVMASRASASGRPAPCRSTAGFPSSRLKTGKRESFGARNWLRPARGNWRFSVAGTRSRSRAAWRIWSLGTGRKTLAAGRKRGRTRGHDQASVLGRWMTCAMH